MVTTPEKTESEYVPLNFGTVIETSLRYWIRNLKSYWVLFFAIQLIILSVAYGAFFLSGGNSLVSSIATSLGVIIPYWLISSYFPTTLAIGLAIVLVVVIIFNIGIQAILAGMVVQHTADYHAELSPTLGESYSHTRNRFWSIIGAQILVTLIFLGIGVGMGVVMFALGLGLLFGLGYLGLFVGLAIGLVLLVILLLYVTVRLTVVIPCVMLGGEGAGGSITRSWHLIGGNWWRTFGIIFIIGLLTLVIGIPTSVVSSFLMFGIFNPYFTLISIVAFIIVSAVITGFTTPLGTTTSSMIYHDLMGRQLGPYEPGQPRQIHSRTECPVCKNPIAANDRFCGKCGRQLDID